MLAKGNEFLEEAAKSLYIANADEIVCQQCRAREDAERRERTLVRDIRLAEEKLLKSEEKLAENETKLAESEEKLAEKDKIIQKLQEELEKMSSE